MSKPGSMVIVPTVCVRPVVLIWKVAPTENCSPTFPPKLASSESESPATSPSRLMRSAPLTLTLPSGPICALASAVTVSSSGLSVNSNLPFSVITFAMFSEPRSSRCTPVGTVTEPTTSLLFASRTKRPVAESIWKVSMVFRVFPLANVLTSSRNSPSKRTPGMPLATRMR